MEYHYYHYYFFYIDIKHQSLWPLEFCRGVMVGRETRVRVWRRDSSLKTPGWSGNLQHLPILDLRTRQGLRIVTPGTIGNYYDQLSHLYNSRA